MEKLKTATIPEIANKVNEIVTYLNRRGGNFKPPTPREVEAYALLYASEHTGIDGRVDGGAFCDSYIKKGWMIGKSKMRDWKAAVRSCVRDGWAKKIPKDRALDASKLRSRRIDQANRDRTRQDYTGWIKESCRTKEELDNLCKTQPDIVWLIMELRPDFYGKGE